MNLRINASGSNQSYKRLLGDVLRITSTGQPAFKIAEQNFLAGTKSDGGLLRPPRFQLKALPWVTSVDPRIF
jgi:hypothetical protein